jgi:DNA-binding beta-propeller fold protein YncE
VDPSTGEVVKTLQVGRSRTSDVVYSNKALWLSTPDDDTVYKVSTATGAEIPISVGQQPRQLAVGKGTVYVTNYSSSDLYAIDTRTNRVQGTPLELPVNPYSLSFDGDAVWVASLPENLLTKVTGPGG